MIRYSMLIQWSDEDNVYVVTLPEFGDCCRTHGSTYEEAAKNGREVLELLIESHQADSQPLPEPLTLDYEIELGRAATERASDVRTVRKTAEG